MRVSKVLKAILGFSPEVVIMGVEIVSAARPVVRVHVRPKVRRRGRCGRCGELAAWFDNGDGARSWRHLDAGYATVEVVAVARRVDCGSCGPTVARVPWARHASAFTRAFEDLVVHDAVVANKQGQKYLTVVCDHFTGKVIWAAKGRSKATVGEFFDALGDERAAALSFVTADGAEWIRAVVAERCPDAVVCIDTFHVVGWATDALDEVRRAEWNRLRQAGAAKEFKGLRFLLRRNWENLTVAQRGTIRDLETANRRTFRAWQLKEELRDIFSMPPRAARSRLDPFVKLARTVARYRDSIEATIEWRLTNGIAESNNASIARIRANARGFHDAQGFITMVMLDRTGLAPTLPWAPT